MQIREIFNGAIPPLCLAQIMKTVDFSRWNHAFVGCSGTFSFERAINLRHPDLPVYGNDVSLLSQVIASVARNEPFEFRFVNKAAHYEEWLEGRSYLDRCAAVIMVLFLARMYPSDNAYNRKHRRHYEADFENTLIAAKMRLSNMAQELLLADYYAGDFRDHLAKAKQTDGAGFIISAPFIEGWYEKWFRFINNNIEWPEPAYRTWNPEDFPALLDEVDASGMPYVAVYREHLADRNLIAFHRVGMKPRFYVYAPKAVTARASVLDRPSSSGGTPFRFDPVDIEKIGDDSTLTVYPCKAGHADYIKSLYLQENIPFTSGLVNFLVYIDDMLAGILTFNRMDRKLGECDPGVSVYLLSDTSTTRFGRVSKLIAMVATSQAVLQAVAPKTTHRPIEWVATTVRSMNPVSMKYRSIYQKVAVKEAGPGERSGAKYIVNYASGVRPETPQEIYRTWRRKYFKDDRKRRVTTSYAKGKGPARDGSGDPAGSAGD